MLILNRSMSTRDINLRVAAHVVRADAEISDLQTLNTMNVEAFVQHTMLDNAVALLWSHGASLIKALARDFWTCVWE